MTTVLRKSYLALSAGTVVVVDQDHDDGNVTVTDNHGTWYTVRKEWLVTLRNRSDVVPAVARINRPERLARRQLWMMFNSAKRGD